MREQELERPPFATLRYDVIKKLNISWTEYVLLDMVYHLSAKHGYCYKTMTSIASDLNLTFTGAKKMVQRLVERELLLQQNNGLSCGSAYIDCAYLEKHVKASKTKQSSERTKTDQTKFREAKSEKHDETVKTELSSINRNLVQQTELSSDKNYIKKDIKKISTNVLIGETHGKQDINEIFTYWQERTGIPITSRQAMNRRAAYNLLRRKDLGMEKTKQLIDGVALAQQDRFAPRIADFCALQAKLNELILWGRQKGTTSAIAQF